jgi:general stress protein 26
MAKRFDSITQKIAKFIEEQSIFFVATAMDKGRINLSPKGLNTLKVIDKNRVIWLNLTGSGNETATHLKSLNRMTIMFCAFEGKPLILRLYGTAKVYHERDIAWKKYIHHFPSFVGSRQLIDMHVDLVQTSCGMSVPIMEVKNERNDLNNWAQKLGKEKINDYWKQKNTISLDGYPTGLFD